MPSRQGCKIFQNPIWYAFNIRKSCNIWLVWEKVWFLYIQICSSWGVNYTYLPQELGKKIKSKLEIWLSSRKLIDYKLTWNWIMMIYLCMSCVSVFSFEVLIMVCCKQSKGPIMLSCHRQDSLFLGLFSIYWEVWKLYQRETAHWLKSWTWVWISSTHVKAGATYKLAPPINPAMKGWGEGILGIHWPAGLASQWMLGSAREPV